MTDSPKDKLLIDGGFVLLVGNMVALVLSYILAFRDVSEIVLCNAVWYVAISGGLPIIWWLYATKSDRWNFYERKNRSLRLVICNAFLVLSQEVWTLAFDAIVTHVCNMKPSRNLTYDMILNLCRIILIAVPLIIGWGLYSVISRILADNEVQDKINDFRWQHVVDTRTNKGHLYDLHILKDMQSGAEVTIKEVDRFVHMFILGASGTGKTSSTLSPSIVCDLDQKCENMQLRQKAILKMVKEGKAIVKGNRKDKIDEWDVTPVEGYENELKEIRKTYPDCGITVMAPNNSLNDDVVRLAKARNLTVNVIDPAKIYTDKNVRMLGLNNFYVPIGLEMTERQIQINNKAQVFAEVLMAVSELNGTGDQYFRDINTSVTTNIAIACMLNANMHGRQSSIQEIQACINDFGKLATIVAELQTELHTTVAVHEIAGKKKKFGKDAERDSIKANLESNVASTDDCQFTPLTDEADIPYVYRYMGLDQYNRALKEDGEAYFETIHFILQELLGEGYEKMFDQARGLRNLINKLLLDPRIKHVLSATGDNFIDFDEALAHNQITVINTALEFGPQGSTALGLFIMLNMKVSVMRRPKDKRSDHFLYIDEASQYMHPMYEDMFALYRQYRVACTLAMQSLSQMEKTTLTKYLKGVIMSAGIHIVFGRINADEMKIYEAMAGIKNVEQVQQSVNKNSEFDDNPSVTTGERISTTQENVMDGAKIRMRDFQQVTVYMIDNGRVKNGFLAKVSFPTPQDFADRHMTYIDWRKLAQIPADEIIPVPQAEKNEIGAYDVAKHATGNTVQNIINEGDRNMDTLNLPSNQKQAVAEHFNEISEKKPQDVSPDDKVRRLREERERKVRAIKADAAKIMVNINNEPEGEDVYEEQPETPQDEINEDDNLLNGLSYEDIFVTDTPHDMTKDQVMGASEDKVTDMLAKLNSQKKEDI